MERALSVLQRCSARYFEGSFHVATLQCVMMRGLFPYFSSRYHDRLVDMYRALFVLRTEPSRYRRLQLEDCDGNVWLIQFVICRGFFFSYVRKEQGRIDWLCVD